MENLPVISCLCVTENRTGFLKKTISCFKAQTYPSKELLIVYTGNENLGHLLSETDTSVRIIRLPYPSSLSLGERRNISIENCRGEYFCQWDDDDWHHNR